MIADDPLASFLRGVLRARAEPLVLTDAANGRAMRVGLDEASAPDGLLPAFLAAGEAVWKAATGHGFGLQVVPDSAALLGYRVDGVDPDSRLVAALATAQAVRDISASGVLPLNDLNAVWRQHIGMTHEAPAANMRGPSP